MEAAGSRRTKLGAVLFGGLVAVGLALVPVTSASAHDFLVDSTPAVNSTVTAPLTTVSLTFNDLVLDLSGDGSSAVLEVTGPDGAGTHFETGCPTILGRILSAPVTLGAPGKYQISWQIVSADGHPVSNAIDFTYAPAAGSTGAGSAGATSAGTAAGPACAGSASSTGVAALPSTAVGTTGTASGGIDPWLILGIAGGIVVLAIVGVVVVLVLSRRSPRVPGVSPGDASGDAPDHAPDDPPEK
jgi:methionine-rich copper-binding protein CopC